MGRLTIDEYLTWACQEGTSDIHISAGSPVIFRIKGELLRKGEEILTKEDAKGLVYAMLSEKNIATLEALGEVDLSYSVLAAGRFRVNAYKQRGTYAAAIRVIIANPPDAESLGLPKEVINFSYLRSGLILVTGPTGSGKSTTLASLIGHINHNRSVNIITLEDPIEYLHKSDKSIIVQREVGADTKSYANALRAALRQDPDVILVGEMRDAETMAIALTAAETGHLVFSTVHTIGAAKTIDRITDVFEPFQQPQIRTQLSTVLKGVVSQQLLPRADGSGRVAALEIMMATPAISNNIREAKTNQINNSIQTNKALGMITMDAFLADLVRKGTVKREVALSYAVNPENFLNQINPAY